MFIPAVARFEESDNDESLFQKSIVLEHCLEVYTLLVCGVVNGPVMTLKHMLARDDGFEIQDAEMLLTALSKRFEAIDSVDEAIRSLSAPMVELVHDLIVAEAEAVRKFSEYKRERKQKQPFFSFREMREGCGEVFTLDYVISTQLLCALQTSNLVLTVRIVT